MFNKLLTKIRDVKFHKFSNSNHRFSTGDFTFKLSPKNFRLPPFDFTKLSQAFNNGHFQGLRTMRQNITNSKLYGYLRAQSFYMRRIVNKRNITGLLATSLALYLAYHYNPYMTKVALHYDDNEFNHELLSSLKTLHNTHFYPSIFGTAPLLQSIMNKFAPPAGVTYIRDTVPLADGGQIVLDWSLPLKKVEYVGTHLHGRLYPYEPAKDTKIMFIIHGLNGGSETNYIQTLVEAAKKDGFRVVVFNQRGVNQPLTSPFPFHGGKLDDFEIALKHVKSKYPAAPIVAVGTSFGGNQLVRYLGEKMDKTGLVGGVLLAAPFDIDDCVDSIEQTVYETFFIRNYFEKNFLPNFDVLETLAESHGLKMEDILKVKNLRDYHTHFTVKLYEHKDVREYFQTTKVTDSHVAGVKVPLLVLHARDDPIATHRAIPIDSLQKNPNIIFAETSHGGHLCWFTGLKPRRWYPAPTIEYLDKVLELKQKGKKENMMQ